MATKNPRIRTSRLDEINVPLALFVMILTQNCFRNSVPIKLVTNSNPKLRFKGTNSNRFQPKRRKDGNPIKEAESCRFMSNSEINQRTKEQFRRNKKNRKRGIVAILKRHLFGNNSSHTKERKKGQEKERESLPTQCQNPIRGRRNGGARSKPILPSGTNPEPNPRCILSYFRTYESLMLIWLAVRWNLCYNLVKIGWTKFTNFSEQLSMEQSSEQLYIEQLEQKHTMVEETPIGVATLNPNLASSIGTENGKTRDEPEFELGAYLTKLDVVLLYGRNAQQNQYKENGSQENYKIPGSKQTARNAIKLTSYRAKASRTYQECFWC